MSIASRILFLSCLSLIQVQSVLAGDTYFKGSVKSYSVYSKEVSIGGSTLIEEQFQQQTALRLMWAHESEMNWHRLIRDIFFQKMVIRMRLIFEQRYPMLVVTGNSS